MHLKSCSKLVRSELRLDLGQQQGALLRRGQSHRLPLAALSTNTLRCPPHGGALHGGAARVKGTENCGLTEEDGTALDVWSVIRPGHVREKIALFAHDNERTVKGSWDVTAKRRRRSSQIQPVQAPPQPVVTVTLQTTPPDPPLADEDDSKLSVVEMVAFLEQRVTCSPHAKLRSSASITLSRAPPPPCSPPAPNPVPNPARPSDRPIPAEEPESVSVSDMVAKLESQCLRRRTQNERRAVGRVLLAEQPPPQPIGGSKTLKSPPPTSPLFATETGKTPVAVRKPDVKIRPCFSNKTKATQTKQSQPELRESNKTPQTKAAQRLECTETQKSAANSAAILTLSVRHDIITKTKSSPEVTSAKRPQTEELLAKKESAQTAVDVSELHHDPSLTLSSPKSKKTSYALPHEEPLPGLLFLTPPPKPCVQPEPRNGVSPASLSRNSISDSLPKTDWEDFDSSAVLSLDLGVQSGESVPRGAESGRTCLTFTQDSERSQNAVAKRKSFSELSVQSEARIELLPPESQSQTRRRLNRIGQSDKRKSFPVSDSLELFPSDPSHGDQSETARRRTPRPATGPDQSERVGGAVLLRSSSDVGSGADRRRRRKATRALSLCCAEGAGRYGEGVGRVSEDFLLMRRRLQSLLEPRLQVSYLSLLPHHLLLQILLLLPTRALAALKCSCQYLRLIIDTYDPRPLDALWVCDPRYRDDPCKQCKRRHRRGDVSLCRWHHKPFCQAMPYGPGYWMCCHGDRRDAPGCNVGLHDNRWVPAFHSINAPLYRQRARDEPDDGHSY